MMEPLWMGIIALIVLFMLLAMGVYVGLALAVVGFAGFIAVTGSVKIAIGILTTTPYTTVAVYALSVVPLFVLMGLFALHSGMGEAVYRAANKWVGHIPGGLGIASMIGNVGFGAVTGSSVVASTVFTKLAVPEMRRYGYDIGFACGVTATAGIIAMLIPPSIYAVLAGIITEQNIGEILVGGIGPGLLMAATFSIGIFIMAKIKPGLAPAVRGRVTWRERFAAIGSTWAVLLLALMVIAGIYFGVFTPTEAGAMGALGSFLIALSTRKLTFTALKASLIETVRIVVMINFVVIGATIFSRFLAISGISQGFIRAITESGVSPIALLALLLAVHLVLGCFLDGMSMMFLTLPVIFPIGNALGFEPIWFLMLIITSIELGLITPPLGLNVYAVKAAAGETVRLEQIFRGIIPFFVMGVGVLGLLIAFPSIITFLPHAMRRR